MITSGPFGASLQQCALRSNVSEMHKSDSLKTGTCSPAIKLPKRDFPVPYLPVRMIIGVSSNSFSIL